MLGIALKFTTRSQQCSTSRDRKLEATEPDEGLTS
jgi:hypothetical protein